MEIEDDQKEPGTIIQEVQKGFMIKDRLLRPSLVGVSKKTEKKNDKSEENQENFSKRLRLLGFLEEYSDQTRMVRHGH